MSLTDPAFIIIPARYDSTRYPGKPLTLIKGISLLERVWRIAKACQQPIAGIYIATDNKRIAEHAQHFGAQVIMTPACHCGTDRVAQAALQLNLTNNIVINLQGDAILTPPWIIDEIISTLRENPYPMATPAIELTAVKLQQFLAHKKISPSSGTTVVFNHQQKALYFSKHILPFQYADYQSLYQHIGLYGYRYQTLARLHQLPPSRLEKLEKLEQLRALENDIPVQVVIVDYRLRSHGSIDTPQDVARIEQLIEQEGELI